MPSVFIKLAANKMNSKCLCLEYIEKENLVR